eukprot:Selendium_serpulae@DN6405_c0_g1_i4.p3
MTTDANIAGKCEAKHRHHAKQHEAFDNWLGSTPTDRAKALASYPVQKFDSLRMHNVVAIKKRNVFSFRVRREPLAIVASKYLAATEKCAKARHFIGKVSPSQLVLCGVGNRENNKCLKRQHCLFPNR